MPKKRGSGGSADDFLEQLNQFFASPEMILASRFMDFVSSVDLTEKATKATSHLFGSKTTFYDFVEKIAAHTHSSGISAFPPFRRPEHMPAQTS